MTNLGIPSKNVLDSFKEAFFRYGWLLPAWIPAAFTLQRGYGNTLLGIYLIWAVPSLWGQLRNIRGFQPFLYLALILTGFVSAAISIDPQHSLHAWGKFVLLSLVFLLTIVVAARKQDALEVVVKVAGLVGVLSIGVFILQFIYHAMQPNFNPASQLRGLVPAYLLPFSWIWMRKKSALLAWVVTAVFVGFLSQADGRTEMLSAAISLTTFWMLTKRSWLAPLLILAGVSVLIVFSRYHGIHEGETASQVTSGRTILWKQALHTPPENLLVGVGPSNVSLYPVVRISASTKVMHLHNFILDAWYEIGVVGLMLYLALFGSLYRIVVRHYSLAGSNAQLTVAWIASFASILSASLLEQSYRSYHLAHFSLFGLALFFVLEKTYRAQENRQ